MSGQPCPEWCSMADGTIIHWHDETAESVLAEMEHLGTFTEGEQVVAPTAAEKAIVEAIDGMSPEAIAEVLAATEQACQICGDPDDHGGRAHSHVTGDGRTRASKEGE